ASSSRVVCYIVVQPCSAQMCVSEWGCNVSAAKHFLTDSAQGSFDGDCLSLGMTSPMQICESFSSKAFSVASHTSGERRHYLWCFALHVERVDGWQQTKMQGSPRHKCQQRSWITMEFPERPAIRVGCGESSMCSPV